MKSNAERLVSRVKKCLFRSDRLRFLASVLYDATHPSQRCRVDHLAFYREEGVMGPLQKDEALCLFALTRVLRPAVVVEFGFHWGHSAFNFLQAMSPGCELYSYDIDPVSEGIAQTRFRRFANFHFLRKFQADFCGADIGNRRIDLCFLDAAHLLDLNQATFRKLEPFLAEGALIVVHDTGTWSKPFLAPAQERLAADMPERWLNDAEFQPCPEERQFVNWVLTDCPGFSEVHLHSRRTLRNGMTLIQKRYLLPTTESSVTPCAT
jgi:predicted O-methyltransferase YrrM